MTEETKPTQKPPEKTYVICEQCKRPFSKSLPYDGCPYCRLVKYEGGYEMDRQTARLWCCQHNEWEKDAWMISGEGSVVDLAALIGRAAYHELQQGPGHHILEYGIGLRDKHGVVIYVGDLVDQWGDKTVIIIEDLTEAHYMMAECTLAGDSCVVIGNIHDNKDLAELIATTKHQRTMAKMIPPKDWKPQPKLGGVPNSIKDKA